MAAGRTSVLIFTFRPLSIFAAASKSSYFAPVQEPMYDLSNSTDGASPTTHVLSGEKGFEIIGSISELSYSNILEYSASESPVTKLKFVAPLLER